MTKVVTGHLLNSAGVAIQNSPVFCTLVPTTGWQLTAPRDQYSDLVSQQTITSSLGAYQFTLKENDLIEPVGTYYQLSFPEVASKCNIRVDSTGPATSTVRDLLIPGVMPPVGQVGNFVTYPAGDSRYAFKGQSTLNGPLVSSEANNNARYGLDGGVWVPIPPGGTAPGVAVYADVATRNTLSPASTTAVGTTCSTTLEDALWVVVDFAGTKQWVQNVHSAGGRKTRLASTANVMGIGVGTPTDFPGYSGTYSWQQWRAYRISAHSVLVGHGAIIDCVVAFWMNGSDIYTHTYRIEPEQYYSFQFEAFVEWVAASKVNDPFKLRLYHSSVGGGVATLDIRADIGSQDLVVHDNGAALGYSGVP